MSDDTRLHPTGTRSAQRGASRREGIAFALGAALISGIAVFVNASGVQQAPNGVTYTTAKNLVAALVIIGVAMFARSKRHASAPKLPTGRTQWITLVAVGGLGGGLAFALFFEGLARLSPVATGDPLRATQAQFLHKTLVVWVAVLAFVFLRERIGRAVAVAIAVLVAGQYLLVGDLGHFTLGRGEVLIGLATLIWAGETVAVRRLLGDVPSLTVAVGRMAIGVLVLIGWLTATGQLAGLGWDGAWWGWAAATGVILAAYVLAWLAALRRAPAVDVTAVLTLAVIVTYALDRVAARPATVDATGLVLVAAGVAVVTAAALAPRRRHPEPVGVRA